MIEFFRRFEVVRPIPFFSAAYAEVAELADAHGSGPCESNFMWVQVPSPACRVSGPVVRKYEGSTLCLHRESAMVQRTFPKHKAAEQLAFIPRCFRGMTSLCPGLEATFGGPHLKTKMRSVQVPSPALQED